MRYVVVGIDGSGSRQWRRRDGSNSHVYGFVHDVITPQSLKYYHHGPDTFGIQVGSILSGAESWLFRTLIELGLPAAEIPSDLKVVIVGHSRGGAIAIELAARLRRVNAPVQFLGLYDAVDRAIPTGGGRIHNVRMTYHALRHPRVGSRWAFSNVGVQEESDNYHKAYFYTSHGGVGGDPMLHPSSFGDDYSLHGDNEVIQEAMGYEPRARYLEQSVAADWFIRGGARIHGVRMQPARPRSG